MAEIALVSSRKARLEAQSLKGDAKAKAALRLSNDPDKFISTTQLGITLIVLLTGIFSGEHIKGAFNDFFNQFDSIKPYSNSISTVLVVIIITYLSLVIGELVPKRIGLSKPEAIAKNVAAPMRVMIIITYPFIWLLTKSTELIVRILNIKVEDNQVTEDEIKAIINEGTEHGAIEEAEQEIIERLFHLGDRNITSIMTHRTDIIWIDIKQKVDKIKLFEDDSIHSVYPVCDGNIDNIKGVALLKDIFKASTGTAIKNIMKQALYVPENNSAYQLLERFKQSKSHYAFIVDEYGTFQGMITLNDILDALVGDIPQQDEENYEIVKREDGSFLIDAQIPFYNFLSYFDKMDWMDEEEHDFDTLAGFILHELERIPATGDKMHWRGFNFEIVDMDNHRIDKLLVTFSGDPEDLPEAE
jgi:putative hemolysin